MTFPSSHPPASRPHPLHYAMPRPSFVRQWGWFIVKNLLGWLLIVAAMALGPLVPGPGGIPLFLIGFALITFPGKRRITARVLKGVPVSPESLAYRRGIAIAALLLPAAGIVYLMAGWGMFRQPTARTGLFVGLSYLFAATSIWFLGVRAAPLFNKLLRITPRIRRTIRPWMRHHGVDLLPPRRRRRFISTQAHATREPDEEILAIHERLRARLRRVWSVAKPWLRRAVAVALTVAIFVWILRPIVRDWPIVRERVLATNWWRVLGASAMFASFLFVFRALMWRRILRSLGHALPVAPATRIWSTSELARYLPGMIWQVVGRQYLAKPYGVRGSVTSTSQVLELFIFLLANMMVAVGCLLFLGFRRFEGVARNWLVIAIALVPVLLVMVHPRVFYGVVNRILARLKKPTLQRQRSKELIGMVAWSILGLLWQGLAIYVVVYELLGLAPAKWWVVTGAYCLAWSAGFLAVWAPGGLGVREAVFIAAMSFALSHAVRADRLGDPETNRLFLIFLAVLLRIWATVGELILMAIAYALDPRGALGRPDAPGRKRLPQDQASAVDRAAPTSRSARFSG